MIAKGSALLALRNRALAVSVVTTGVITDLSATATGYHRASGSFVTDGFVPGMEITPASFTTNTVDLITGVTASDLTTLNARAVEAVGTRSIAVALPSIRAWELTDITPNALKWMVREEMIPGPSKLLGQKNGGLVQEIGLYVLTLFGPEKYGPLAMRKMTDALEALFAPGTTVTAGSHTVRVRTDSSVYSGQILPQGDGHARCQLTVPYEAFSINSIAA